ncbi:MAG: UDP-N-acetylglucosamine 2-epimerase [Candidatus Margulisiibacteriota bacterium]
MSNNKRKVCVISGSRAEYGLLRWLMSEIDRDRDLVLQTVVCGMHLSAKFGLTYREIVKDGFKINAKVKMSLDSDRDHDIVDATAEAMVGFGRAFEKLKPDIIVLLGDRFEILAAANAATLMRLPIAHIHGGEVTAGAYDDAIRHAITKMALFHFVAHEDYARRVVQMGESPERVFNFGAPGLDNIKRLKLLNKKELEQDLDFALGRDVALVTYHPATMEKGWALSHVRELLAALDQSGLRSIFTMPNADAENQAIRDAIEAYVKRHPQTTRVFDSLGRLRYLSLLKQVGLMVGNSSSGIIEAPSFQLPVVNIGSRQSGRLKAQNIIDVDNSAAGIRQAIEIARSKEFTDLLKRMKNPFGNGTASARIKNFLKKVNLNMNQKVFHDLPALKIAREEIVLIGGGGHCKVVIDAIQKGNAFKVCGIIGKGDDSRLTKIFNSGCKRAFIAIGSVGNPGIRKQLAQKLSIIGFKVPAIVHPSAVVASNAQLEEGVFIAPRAVVGPGSRLGKYAIVNTRAAVDHDCWIGDFVHIAPGAVLSGGVEVGQDAHIGTGASVIQYKKIGERSMIGAGSVVVKDIPAGSKAYGNPCRVAGKNDE